MHYRRWKNSVIGIGILFQVGTLWAQDLAIDCSSEHLAKRAKHLGVESKKVEDYVHNSLATLVIVRDRGGETFYDACSGGFYQDQKHFVTALHCVTQAKSMFLVVNDEDAEAIAVTRVESKGKETDVAVLELEKPYPKAKPIAFASTTVSPGRKVMILPACHVSIDDPKRSHGIGYVLRKGTLISGKNSLAVSFGLDIHPGMSGSLVIDEGGAFVGVATANGQVSLDGYGGRTFQHPVIYRENAIIDGAALSTVLEPVDDEKKNLEDFVAEFDATTFGQALILSRGQLDPASQATMIQSLLPAYQDESLSLNLRLQVAHWIQLRSRSSAEQLPVLRWIHAQGLDPLDSYTLGSILHNVAETRPQAIDIFETILKEYPDQAVALMHLGYYYTVAGDRTNAARIEALRVALLERIRAQEALNPMD